MKTCYYEGNIIEVEEWSITGKEVVKYNGDIVSQKRTMFGGNHIFRVEEKGEMVNYEVRITPGFLFPKTIIRRNGLIIYN